MGGNFEGINRKVGRGTGANTSVTKHQLVVLIGSEVDVNGIRLHVLATARTVEEATNGQQRVLRPARQEIDRRPPAKNAGLVRALQPRRRQAFVREQDAERLMNAEDRGNTRERVGVEREGPMLASELAPMMVGRARGIAQDRKSLLLGEAPEIRDGEEGAKRR